MTALTALAYSSQANHLFTETELFALLADARGHNLLVDVTGVLLYDDGHFFQYLEGPAAGLAQSFARVQASRRHRDIQLLMQQPLSTRFFQGWQMGFAAVPVSELLRLNHAVWLRSAMLLAKQSKQEDLPEGLQLLTDFWCNASKTTALNP